MMLSREAESEKPPVNQRDRQNAFLLIGINQRFHKSGRRGLPAGFL